MKIDFDILFKHLARWDKDTYIFGLIAVSTLGALAAGAPSVATVFAGCAFTVLYIGWRYALINVQAREREAALKSSGRRRARRIVDETATSAEKIPLENLKNPAKTRRKIT